MKKLGWKTYLKVGLLLVLFSLFIVVFGLKPVLIMLSLIALVAVVLTVFFAILLLVTRKRNNVEAKSGTILADSPAETARSDKNAAYALKTGACGVCGKKYDKEKMIFVNDAFVCRKCFDALYNGNTDEDISDFFTDAD